MFEKKINMEQLREVLRRSPIRDYPKAILSEDELIDSVIDLIVDYSVLKEVNEQLFGDDGDDKSPVCPKIIIK